MRIENKRPVTMNRALVSSSRAPSLTSRKAMVPQKLHLIWACPSTRAARREALKMRVQLRRIESEGAWLRLQHNAALSIK